MKPMQHYTVGEKGQALVMLLVFMVISITITTAAVGIIMANSMSVSRVEQGVAALTVAESGAENALLRLIRNPNYGGESLTLDGGNATVTVTGVNPKTIQSQGTVGSFSRTVQIQATITNTILTVNSWQEVFP